MAFFELSSRLPYVCHRSEQMLLMKLCEKSTLLFKNSCDRLKELPKRIRYLIKSRVSVGNQLTRSTPITTAMMSQPSVKANFCMCYHQWKLGSSSFTEVKREVHSLRDLYLQKKRKMALSIRRLSAPKGIIHVATEPHKRCASHTSNSPDA